MSTRGRPALIERSRVIEEILKYKDSIVRDNKIVSKKSEIWCIIASKLGDAIKPATLYKLVICNEQNVRDKITSGEGVNPELAVPAVKSLGSTDASFSVKSSVTEKLAFSMPKSEIEALLITKTWARNDKVRRKTYKRTYVILNPGKWQAWLLQKIQDERPSMKCGFQFKKNQFVKDGSKGTIQGGCKCGSTLHCTVKNESADEYATFTCSITAGTGGKCSKRNFRAPGQEAVAKELLTESAAIKEPEIDGVDQLAAGIEHLDLDSKRCLDSKEINDFLKNGSVLKKPVQIDGKKYFVQMTCVFDSVMQVLLSGAVDCPNYYEAIKTSTNPMLQLVARTIINGVIEETYEERARLFLKWEYRPTPKVQKAASLISYTLSGYDSVHNFVSRSIKEEPSLHVIEECSHLCKREYSLVLMSPNHRVIAQSGYEDLERALNFRPRLDGLACFNATCPGKMSRIHQLRLHLFIDGDVRVSNTKAESVPCKLANLPKTLKLGDEENYVKYNLIGTVACRSNHFTAYCLRNMSQWEQFDDMALKSRNVRGTRQIVPHLFLYIRTSET